MTLLKMTEQFYTILALQKHSENLPKAFFIFLATQSICPVFYIFVFVYHRNRFQYDQRPCLGKVSWVVGDSAR